MSIKSTIIYADAGGSGYTDKFNATLATARANSAGAIAHTASLPSFSYFKYSGDSAYYVRRGFMTFNTATLPPNINVTGATLSMYVISKLDPLSASASVVESTQASGTALAVSDHANFNTTKLANDITFASVTAAQYLNIPLTVLTTINKAGYTKFALVSATDLTATAHSNTTPSELNIAYPATTGTAQDPYITIYYEDNITYKFRPGSLGSLL